MLKKQLEKQLAAANIIISNMKSSAEVDRALIKSAADRERKHTKLRRHVDKALSSIGGIMAVNCREIEEWHKHGNASLMYAHDANEESPVCPPITELYASLTHISEILNRPVEGAKKDTRFGY